MKSNHSFLSCILILLSIIIIAGCHKSDDSSNEASSIHYSTERITHGDKLSQYDLSSDGRFVVYGADDNSDEVYDIFLYDSLNRQSQCITVGIDGNQANGNSAKPNIDADGSFIVFSSDADNLVPDDDNGLRDIFIYNCQSENLTRIVIDHAPPATGCVYAGLNDPAISSDGRFVAFYSFYKDKSCDGFNDCKPSYGNLTRYDFFTDEIKQKFIDEHGYYEPVFGGYLNVGYTGLSISGDGRYLIFETESEIVSKDTNILRDVYSYDFQAEETIIASVNSDGSVSKEYYDCSGGSGCLFVKPCGDSNKASMSDDGQLIVFKSSALELDEFTPQMVLYECIDYNGIFVHERRTEKTIRVSINNSGSPIKANNESPNISPDGKYVIFNSFSTNLVGEPETSLFIHDLQTRKTSNIIMDSPGADAIISNQAKVVLYKSHSGHLILGKIQSEQ